MSARPIGVEKSLLTPLTLPNIKDIYEFINNYMKKHIYFPNPTTYKIISVWVLGTYIYDKLQSYPYLYIFGPKQSGKTKLLGILEVLCCRSANTVSISTSALYRIIEKQKPTLLIDEADILQAEERLEMRKVILAGYKRSGVVYRCFGKEHDIRAFPTYCPKVFGCTKILDDQIMSRCLMITMQRTSDNKIADIFVLDWGYEDKEFYIVWKEFRADIEKKLSVFKREELLSMVTPDKIHGRHWELWKPLLTVAKLISDELYNDIEEYAIKYISNIIDEEPDHVVISVITSMFEKSGYISNRTILERVNTQEGYEWMKSRYLGYVMKRLGFRSRRVGGRTEYFIKENHLSDLCDAFNIGRMTKKTEYTQEQHGRDVEEGLKGFEKKIGD